MRRLAPALAAAALAAALASPPVAAASGASVGQPAPGFSLPGTDGETHSLEALRGRSAAVLVFYRGVW